MDIDYLLIILPSIVFLGIFGLILVIWQYGNFFRKEKRTTVFSQSPKVFTEEEPNYSARVQLQPLPFTQFSPQTAERQSNTPETLIILQLMAAEERPYKGYELIQTLSSAGFHYGEMNIFHYFSDQDKKKERLFSLASAVEPGTFDLTLIGEILLPGLCLFMSPNNIKNSHNSFELMLETAQLLIQDLGGTLCDGQRQPITPNLLTYYRSQLHAYA
ncbi:MAG: cell division protein ZipA C-terminal FtsZ-binding domain-containing protein [Rickettsiella sp.]|nr:cell division protein ZipA C-terminal FtsZ-binding domain-containing protein [Rickettsiella sp.]